MACLSLGLGVSPNMLASGRGPSSACTARGTTYKPPACCQRLALFDISAQRQKFDISTQRSALRLGPELANEKAGEILKVSTQKTIVLRGGYGAGEM